MARGGLANLPALAVELWYRQHRKDTMPPYGGEVPIRWLHLSDVHESFREGGHRRQVYGEIIREVERCQLPQLVFLTGDLAFSGTHEEYASLQNQFIGPLK